MYLYSGIKFVARTLFFLKDIPLFSCEVFVPHIFSYSYENPHMRVLGNACL